ncbi:MAG: GspH/FimT family pseudopilin [Betaproteobacteria bacterium]|nr:GspH/FimT family pseudopilin [Betaproteobacteria bacterium]
MPSPVNRYRQGFTMIELMMVVALTGILATIAAPSFKDFVLATRVRTAASDLYASLVLARSEAIKRSASVTVTPASGDWRNGWTVAVGGVTLQSQEAVSSIDAAAGSAITYRRDGRVATAVAPIQFKVAASPTVQMRCISIDLSGRPLTKTDTNGDVTDGCN